MIGSSGAEALSRANGDEQLLKIQALNNEQRQKRQEQKDSKKRDDDDSAGAEQASDTFESAVAGVQNKQVQELESKAGRSGPPKKMRASIKSSQKDDQTLKKKQLETEKPAQDDAGHIDVSG